MDVVFLDLVVAPFAGYVVVVWRDPDIKGHPERAGQPLDFSGDYVYRVSGERENLEDHVLSFLRQHPDLKVNAQRLPFGLDMPAGSVGDLLSDASIRLFAEEHRQHEILMNRRLRQAYSRIHMDDPLSAEEYAADFKRVLPLHVMDQLVRETSKNHLLLDNDEPAYDVVFDGLGRGLAIIGGGLENNCGHGVCNVFIYERLDVARRRLEHGGAIQVETLRLKRVDKTHMFRPSLGLTSGEEWEKLKERGQIVIYDGEITYIGVKPARSLASEVKNLPA